jgi:PAS domain S-box-containing protein
MSQTVPEQVTVNIERLLARQAGEPADGAPHLQSALSIAELSRRPSRPPDHAGENRALIALARELAASPDGILQKLADTALELCRAHSAGLSLLEEADQKRNFHWRAIAGQWASHLGGGTPREFGPCGTVLDCNVALLFSRPERDFPYFSLVQPYLEEGLLVPFYVKGEAVGTIWVVSHDESRRFDAEDLRLMTNLGHFTAAAYQAWLSVNATKRLATIIETSNDAIASKDLNGILNSWNVGAERLFGYTAEEVIGKPVTILIPLDRQDEETGILERIRRGERVDHYDTVRRRKDGSLVDISLTVSPLKDENGNIVGASKIARDITERKRAEERVTLLAREVDHRAKNVLALAQATVNLTQAETPEALKTAIGGRLQAVAKAHAFFAESRWAGADLGALVAEELAPYRQDGESAVTINGAYLLLEPNTAQSMAVVVHELTTNAVKYGALSSPAGRVQIAWSLAADGRFVFRWSETGGPPVEPPQRQGFGSRVTEQMVRGQMKGEVRFDWRAEGLVCEIVVPELPTAR